MSYTPKSKYQILQSSGNEWGLSDGSPYIGPYILTSDGAFEGNNITRKGPQLVRLSKPSPKINNIQESTITQDYYAVNPGVVNMIQQTHPIISTKTLPSLQDYQQGSYVRYFAKKVNSLIEYYEIDQSTYKSIKSKSLRYDHYSFEVSSIIWALEGDVRRANQSILNQKSRKYPNIFSLFSNLNEFQTDTPIPKITPEPTQPQTGYIAPKTVQEQITPFTGGGGY
jgi:hypothetical protein